MRKTLITAETKVFPANYLLLLLEFLKNQGHKTDEILQKIQLPNHIMEDPEQFVSQACLKHCLTTILEETQIPELGLHFGQQLNFTAHGDMGNAIIASKTLNEALQIVLKYFKTRTPLVHVDFDDQENYFIIRADFNISPPLLKYFLIDALFTSMITVRKFLLNSMNYDIHLYLTRPKPNNPAPYHDIFGDHVHFDSEYNEYRIHKENLSQALPLANPIAREIAERKCQQKMRELEHLDDFISKAKSIMLRVPCHFPNIDELSKQMNLSSRTLRRKLKDLGSSYQEILDDLRKELAINYLKNTELSIIEIAHMLEFSDSSNFSSAFRRWTNKTPGDFRG